MQGHSKTLLIKEGGWVIHKLSIFVNFKDYKYHSWQKFKIVLVKNQKENCTPFMQKICQNTIFGSSRISFHFLIQFFKVVVFPSNFWFQKFKVVVFPSNFWFRNFKVVVFPSNFWKTTIIWQFFRVILNFAQECYYLENKVGVVDFTKARGLVKF